MCSENSGVDTPLCKKKKITSENNYSDYFRVKSEEIMKKNK